MLTHSSFGAYVIETASRRLVCLPFQARMTYNRAMGTVQLTVDSPEIFRRLAAMADERHCTLGELIVALVKDRDAAPIALPPFVGLFAHEPELMDQVMEDVYRTRQSPLRSEQSDG